MYPAALAEALEAQVTVGQAIETVDLGLDSRCPGWQVRDVLNHSIAVTLKFAAFARGDTDAPRTPKGDHLGTDHRAALRNAATTARDAWLGTDLTRTCHLPFGSYPASIAAGINLFDVLAHCWDIAGPTRNQLAIPNRLWEDGLTAAHAVIGHERDLDHYSAEIDVAATASPAEKFLAFLGRAEEPLEPKHDGEADPRAELPDDASPA
ncbi:MAG: TIGR03086 family metal-binding protein [Acidimicrobiales bacterium]